MSSGDQLADSLERASRKIKKLEEISHELADIRKFYQETTDFDACVQATLSVEHIQDRRIVHMTFYFTTPNAALSVINSFDWDEYEITNDGEHKKGNHRASVEIEVTGE